MVAKRISAAMCDALAVVLEGQAASASRGVPAGPMWIPTSACTCLQSCTSTAKSLTLNVASSVSSEDVRYCLKSWRPLVSIWMLVRRRPPLRW